MTKGKEKAGEDSTSKIAETLALLERAGGEPSKAEESRGSEATTVQLGTGLPALPKKVLEKMLKDEYVDFNELQPAKGKGRTVPQALEGQVIVVQAADLMANRKIIPDLATWTQCFGI